MGNHDETLQDDLLWRDALDLELSGQGAFHDFKHPFDRLPARAEGVVRDKVWELSRMPMGISVKFNTDADAVHASWTLDIEETAHWNRDTLVRALGLDCYGLADDGVERWVGIGAPEKGKKNQSTKLNRLPLDGAFRQYRVYLPQSAPVSELSVGVPKGARLETVESDIRQPIVYYGTSIAHGGCVSRGGMPHACQLERRLRHPLINMGFSGNGKMEPEVTEFLAELEAALFIVDCLPNMRNELVEENMPKLVEIIRERQPDVPILFVEDRLLGGATFQPACVDLQRSKSETQHAVFKRLVEAGTSNLHRLPAANFFGDDFDGTIDGSHPNDLGAFRMANALEPKVRSILSL